MTTTSDENLASLQRVAQKLGVEIPEFVEPSDRHIVVDGHRLHYLDWGNDDRVPMVFLHGRALTAHTWDLVCLSLRQDYHCLSIDLRGHGQSEWSPVMDYHVNTLAADVQGFIEQTLTSAPILVGMSLGAMTALRTAARMPVSPQALVIVDLVPRHPGVAVSEVAEIPANPTKDFRSGPMVLDSVDDFVEWAVSFNPRRDRQALRSSLLHNLRQRPDGKWTWRYDQRQLDNTTNAYGSPSAGTLDYWDDAKAVDCPTLIVRGSESDHLSREDAAAFAKEFRHGSWVEVDGAGHTVQGDNPAGLLRELRKFLKN